MIEKYWNEMFAKFKTESGKFVIPDFPEPIMSAHFGVKNKIDVNNKSDPFEVVQFNYKLCTFDPLDMKDTILQEKLNIKMEPLMSAIAKDSFWELQKQSYPDSFDFIKRLLPFLSRHSNEHYHFFMDDHNSNLLVSLIVGVSPSACLIFNGMTVIDSRGKGLMKDLIFQTRTYFSDKSIFYWTKFKWLVFDAKVQDYQIVK